MVRKKAYNGDFGTLCPLCKRGKLNIPRAKSNSDGTILYRERTCAACGALVADTIIRQREILRLGDIAAEASPHRHTHSGPEPD